MTIKIISEKGTTDITELIPSAKWSGDYQQAARCLQFSILASPEDKSIPVVNCPLGSGVQLLESGKLLFDGFILTRSKGTDGHEIAITCYDRGFYLKRNQATYRYKEQTAEQITTVVAGEFGIQVGRIALTNVPLSRVFMAVPLFDILTTAYTLASRVTGKKYFIGFQGAKLCVSIKEPPEKALVIEGGANLIAASTTESVENMVNTVAVYDQNGTFVSKIEKADMIKLYGLMQKALTQNKTDDRMAEAQEQLDQNGAVSQKITVDSLGNVGNITGGAVVVQEPYTGLQGLFFIDGDVHEWKRGQYYNKLTLNFQNLMNEKEAGSPPAEKPQK